jgi:hypothetical protein
MTGFKGFRELLVLLLLSAVFIVYYGVYVVLTGGNVGVAHASRIAAASAPADELNLDIPRGERANEVVANHGFIIVKSTPSMASIYINGSLQGETPLKLSLKPGSHMITLKMGGVTWTERITVEKGQTRILKKYL